MKLTVNKDSFQKLVSFAERSSGKNPTLPTLSGILIKTSKNQLILTSTNLEVGFKATLEAKIEKEGMVVSPIKTLLQLLASIPHKDLKLESSGKNLSITSENSSTNLNCFPVDDFPSLPKVSTEGGFKIIAKELTSAFKDTLAAATNPHLKPELSSVFIFSKTREPLTFVATDSFRLAERRTSLSTNPTSLLVPHKSAQEVQRIFEETDGEVEVSFNKNQILFQSENISFISRLNEGNFPEYQGIIPKSFLTQVVMDRAKLINSIKTASVFSSRLSNVVLKVDQKEKFLEISATSSELGEHHSLNPTRVAGESVEISFNYHYLLDALHTISEPNIFLGFNGREKAVLIRGEEGGNYFHLIMPIRSA